MIAVRRPLNIAVVSDTHLEYRPLRLDRVYSRDVLGTCDVLCLAGDIGSPFKPAYSAFIAECAAACPRVAVIAGNHEYFNDDASRHIWTMADVKAQINNVCATHPNVDFLDNTSIRIDDKHELLGTTLWTCIDVGNEQTILNRVNDYKYIALGIDERLTVTRVRDMHTQALTFVRSKIQELENADRRAIVVSHHAPIVDGASEQHFDGDAMSSAYKTDLSHMMDGKVLPLWLCGHTHYNFDVVLTTGTRVAANQFGGGMNPLSNYNRERVFTIQ